MKILCVHKILGNNHELVEKVKGEWEGIFIEQEDDIRNIFLSNLDASISMGISLELITIEETNYLAGR